MKPNEQVAFLAAVIVNRLAAHLDLAEPVGGVELADRIDIVLQQPLAKAPAACKRGDDQVQPAAQQVITKIFVPVEGDAPQAVPSTARYLIGDHLLGGLLFASVALAHSLSHGIAHVHVEIAFALEVIADAAAAFLQQILIYRAFLVDGQEFAQRLC